MYCHTRGGGKYEGDWKNDVVHGYGVRKYDHPMHAYKWLRHYSGSWKNGEWYGKGTIEYLDGKYSIKTERNEERAITYMEAL